MPLLGLLEAAANAAVQPVHAPAAGKEVREAGFHQQAMVEVVAADGMVVLALGALHLHLTFSPALPSAEPAYPASQVLPGETSRLRRLPLPQRRPTLCKRYKDKNKQLTTDIAALYI